MANPSEVISSLLKRNTKRLLRLYFPNDDGPSAGLLINHLQAEEQLSRDFAYVVTVLSNDPEITLTDVQGRMVCVELQREDQTMRYFNGLCFEFALLRIENSLAVYQMVLRPWLALFKLRSNHFLFHDLSISRQTAQLFLATGWARHEFRLRELDPARTFSCQYDESDYNYLHRRWEAMGWHYWYEHTLQGHTLIISDTSSAAAAIDGAGNMAWHHGGGSSKHDKIAEWSRRRKLVSAKVSLSSYDFKRSHPEVASIRGEQSQEAIPAMEVHHYQDLYGFKNRADGEKIAQRRIEQIESESQLFQAKGNHRAAQPGRWFTLKKDFVAQAFSSQLQDNEYLITEVRHQADNNFLNASGGAAHYENQFSCVPRKVQWRPALGLNSQHVKITGCDTATVVGLPDENIFTDAHARVRVRFHWDREGNNAASSAWIRVGTPWAGALQGSISLPRIGSEVLVQWLGGSPDRPIIIAGLYNQNKMPPWALPSQQVLTGWRSRELAPALGNRASGRSNHMILDDTHEKIQVQLKSDHACSQLSLGHITRIESNAGRKDSRGEGWELRSNAWGALRASKGILISTDLRQNAAKQVKDMLETHARLDYGQQIHQGLAEAALHYGALDDKKQQAAVAEVLKAQNAAIQGKGEGAGEGSADADFPQLAQAHLVLASPAGIETTSAQSTHISSAQHTAFTTGKNFSIVSGDSWYSSVAKTFRLFVDQAGMKLVALAGDVDLEALSKNIHLLAKLNLTYSANHITIAAKEEIEINGGGSYARFNASGIEYGTTGKAKSHAVTHSLIGPHSLRVPNEVFPDFSVEPHSLRFAALGADDLLCLAGWHGLPFCIKDEEGTVLAKGVVPDDGKLPRVTSPHTKNLMLRLGDPMGAELMSNERAFVHAEDVPFEELLDDDDDNDDDDDDNSGEALAGNDENEFDWMQSPYYQEVVEAFSHHHSEFLSEDMVAELLQQAAESESSNG